MDTNIESSFSPIYNCWGVDRAEVNDDSDLKKFGPFLKDLLD